MTVSITITVPDNYGYVILSTVVGSMFLVPTIMGGSVMTARKECDVPYPNLYATPGFHKRADEFNRVQRGHQNMFESLGTFAIANLIGGLRHPITCTACSVLYSAGCYLYLLGYKDMGKDVKMARYAKGGAIKFIGYFGSIFATISVAAGMLGWW
ncbi:glutathione S-transferase [Fistulifera solaris]|jgi:glutathione S-transferase|uniref:Glutathione S-transferase n=1 Tax=Fistulifera solaris TaxID=1519565 RepID=A0A1Z5K3M8_FISSO|nr:glutathione S-transferase [Fistulifera solaris]|eukprot:GAX20857.1 glutathione S-transferase [Fistulifera solaris]